MSNRPWTEDELMILEITMIEKDLTYEELGVMFERTKQAVANKAYKIRKERNITSNRWTKSELATLRELTNKKYDQKKIAEILGRTSGAICNKKYKEKIRFSNNILPYKTKIEELAKQGLTYPEIAKEIHLPRKTLYDFCRHYNIKAKNGKKGTAWRGR